MEAGISTSQEVVQKIPAVAAFSRGLFSGATICAGGENILKSILLFACGAESARANAVGFIIDGDSERQEQPLREGFALFDVQRFALSIGVDQFHEDMAFVIRAIIIGIDHADRIVQLQAIFEALTGARTII